MLPTQCITLRHCWLALLRSSKAGVPWQCLATTSFTSTPPHPATEKGWGGKLASNMTADCKLTSGVSVSQALGQVAYLYLGRAALHHCWLLNLSRGILQHTDPALSMYGYLIESVTPFMLAAHSRGCCVLQSRHPGSN